MSEAKTPTPEGVVVSGIDDAKAELNEWEWGHDKTTRVGVALTELAIDSAKVVLDAFEDIQVLVSLTGELEIALWPIGGDHLIIRLDTTKLLANEIMERDGDASEFRECAAKLRELADACDEAAAKMDADE